MDPASGRYVEHLGDERVRVQRASRQHLGPRHVISFGHDPRETSYAESQPGLGDERPPAGTPVYVSLQHEGLHRVASGHPADVVPVSYTHLRAHETRHDLVCRLLLEKKKKKKTKK